ncbi:integrase_H2C2 domain-containing protein [Trichonephila clavipes]|nr:integrase_H2C2 domain-containing protein [Trichonephila clavipes]
MEINGIDRVCLRDSGSSIDVCSRSWINENDLLGEYVWLKSPLDEICHCLPLAKIKIKTKKGEFYTKAAIKQDSSDNDLYLLGNRTAELLESDEQGVHLVNAVGGEDDSFIIPAFEGEGGKSLAKVNGVEFKEEQRKCPDLKPLWDKALTGIDKEFRCCMKGILETGGVMGQCVQMWTRNYGALGQTARVCFGVLCANRKKEEVKRDFGPANKKERGACCEHTPGV